MNKLILIAGALVLLGITSYLLMPKAQLKSENVTLLNEFMNYQIKYNKVYASPAEASYRLAIFSQSVERINKINADPSKTYKAGINQFSDMTKHELINKILMKELPQSVHHAENGAYAHIKVADSVDWRQKGAVTPVKNQGSCGSCWSFSTTGVLEGAYYLQKGSLESFAEQQLVDCCGADGFQCQGCSGAWPEWALDWVKAKGITTEDKYPYVGVDQSCAIDSGDYKISSYTQIAANDETSVIAATNVQPVSICVDASTWFDYTSGIFNDCNASPSLDHAVLLIGYDSNAKFHIVKNSWDTTWGESGYIRLPKDVNACGLAMHAITAQF